MKVVSSMGEQSVGKSFTLNHLVDTSFAGNAMRTTGKLWSISELPLIETGKPIKLRGCMDIGFPY